MGRVIVCGAGPAGMMAAIAAARSGAQVTLLEAMEKPGKKLLMTGNGHCNLTFQEEGMDGVEKHYHSMDRMKDTNIQSIRQYPPSWLREFFRELGMETMIGKGGIYPQSNQATTVLSILQEELKERKVKQKFREKVTGMKRKPDGTWTVFTEGWKYEADAVILTTGSKAVPETGSDGSGYLIAEKLGHHVTEVLPALSPVKIRENYGRMVAGVRNPAKITLLVNGREIGYQAGELQWTPSGISGIAIFQLSGDAIKAVKEKKEACFLLDLAPEYSKERLKNIFDRILKQYPQRSGAKILEAVLPEKLSQLIWDVAGGNKKGKNMAACLNTAVENIKGFPVHADGKEDFRSCQVCRGGVSMKEIDRDSMESMRMKGLFFAGEVLDLDGDCGGYNLQWAWSSGYAAGTAAAERSFS